MMRASSGAELLETFGRFAGLPTSHLHRLPPSVSAACDAAGRGAARRASAPIVARRLAAAGGGEARPVDSRMQTHAHGALPAPLSLAIDEALRPFNQLLGATIGEAAPHLRGVRWLHPPA